MWSEVRGIDGELIDSVTDIADDESWKFLVNGYGRCTPTEL
jgi:hypothetical protein